MRTPSLVGEGLYLLPKPMTLNMNTLFAPWRMKWVTRDREDDSGEYECLFCNLPDRGADQENLVVARSEHVYVLLNNRPYNPGHVMIIPFEHVGTINDLEDDLLLDMVRTMRALVRAIKAGLSPQGFNIGFNIGDAGGASIPDHVHMHVVPRWGNDTTFMPLTANTAIVEEAVAETYDRIHNGLAAHSGAPGDDLSEAVRL